VDGATRCAPFDRIIVAVFTIPPDGLIIAPYL
jgi:hypothetical protein